MLNRCLKILARSLSSLELTVACLAFLLVLVFSCTLEQVHLGTYGAVQKYFRESFLYGSVPGVDWKIPVFPAGGVIGGLLLLNLVAAHARRFQAHWKKSGIWLIHLGLILLVLGEFVTGLCAVEAQMAIEEGSSRNYTESLYETELAVVDSSDSQYDEVISIPESVFSRLTEIRHARLPFTLLVKKYYPNAAIGMRQGKEGLPSMATLGAGTGLSVMPLEPVTRDDRSNQVTAFVELLDGDRSLGTWLLSTALGEPQSFTYQGRGYELAIRPKRRYLNYTIALKDFRHDLYPGTEIPKNFSSLIRLTHKEKRVDRDVLISMNTPLRYEGLTFYQASFGKNDTLSVLQVVKNPGWLLPYFSCALVAVGLLIQFGTHLLSFRLAQE